MDLSSTTSSKESRKKSKNTQMIGCQKTRRVDCEQSDHRDQTPECEKDNEQSRKKNSTQTSKKNRPMEKAETDKDSDSLTRTFHCANEAEKI